MSTDIITRGMEETEKVDNLLDDAEQRIFGISEKRIRPSFIPIKEVVKESFEVIEARYEKKEKVTGLPTGFTDLDDLTSGLHPGDLVVVAGRPSMGKTAFSLCVAQYAAIQKGKSVGIFSLEMSREQLVLRMLCAEAWIDGNKLRSGYLSHEDWPRLTAAAGRLSEAPIYIDDGAALPILEMRAKARRLKAERGLSLLIIDYLQLAQGRGQEYTREQEISGISRSLKALAKELSIPIIAVSQLSRAVESRVDKRPMLSDLRESGAIEQDADLVIFLYRDEVYNERTEAKGISEVLVRKQRNGPVGTVRLKFFDKYTRFENLEERYNSTE